MQALKRNSLYGQLGRDCNLGLEKVNFGLFFKFWHFQKMKIQYQ